MKEIIDTLEKERTEYKERAKKIKEISIALS